MKVQTGTVDEIERIGVGVDQAFSINFDAKMARILADGLYSDKVQSVIRELSCNAWDSHVMAGKADTPFTVHFPTTLEPWFSVQDSGTGLSHRQVLDIYTRYGASTKTNSNEVIGQLGLGSKSPFALTNAFDVTTRQDGVENHYSMYRNEHGMPSVAHLGDNPTDEGNGVTVRVPVRAEQRREFMDKAREVYKWFPLKPIVQGLDKLDLEEFTKAYEGTGWYIINRGRDRYGYHNRQRPVALMGMVAYPLDQNNIPGLSDDQRAMLGLPIVLEFGIGDLEVAANREALGYDDRTILNIKAKLDVLLTELGAKFEQLIATAPTEYEARRQFGEIFDYGNDMHHEFGVAFGNRGLHWNGKLIKGTTIKVAVTDFYPLDKDGKATDMIHSCNDSCKRPRRQSYYSSDNLNLRCEKKTVIFYNDLSKGGLTRIHEFNKAADYKHNVYIFGEHPKLSAKKLGRLLAGVEVKLASALPKLERAKAEQRTNMLRWKGGDSKIKAWEQVDIDLNAGGYYVELDGWDVRTDVGLADSITAVVHNLRESGILLAGTQIYAMRSKNRDVVRNHPDWKELFAFARGQTALQVQQRDLGQLVADSNEYQKLLSNASWSPWDRMRVFKDDESPMALFCANVKEIKSKVNQMNRATTALQYLANRFGIALDTAKPKHALAAQHQAMLRRYPMLDFVGNRWGNIQNSDVSKALDYVNYVDVCDTFYNLNQAEENTVD